MLTDKQLQDLRANVACTVLDVGHNDFETARRVWNGMIESTDPPSQLLLQRGQIGGGAVIGFRPKNAFIVKIV